MPPEIGKTVQHRYVTDPGPTVNRADRLFGLVSIGSPGGGLARLSTAVPDGPDGPPNEDAAGLV